MRSISMPTLFSLIYQKTESPSEKAEKLIPEALRKDPGVAHNLGWIGFSTGRIKKAISWFETAVDNDTENTPEFKATLGQFLLPSNWDFEIEHKIDFESEAIQLRIDRGIELLTTAWNQIKGTDLEKHNSNWVLNRAVGKRLRGDSDGAADDIDTALRIDPHRAEYIKHRVFNRIDSSRI